MKNKHKTFILLWTYLIIFFTPKIKNNKSSITYHNGKTSYATYKGKNIYIVHKKPLYNDKNNIYIIDDRSSEDPDISIYNSYQFTHEEDIDELINLLIDYEKKYPSNWNRSASSMKREWIIHNICYFLNIENDRTIQVDFNNSDEETYNDIIKIIEEILNIKDNELENTKTKILTKKN